MIYLLTYADCISWLENNMLVCPSVRWLHMQCLGCGMQRSVIALLQGQWLVSLKLYPALLPMLILLGFTIIHLFYKFANGARFILKMQILVVSIVVVHYFYKLITNQIFI